jgi:hypothetical protein
VERGEAGSCGCAKGVGVRAGGLRPGGSPFKAAVAVLVAARAALCVRCMHCMGQSKPTFKPSEFH